MTERLADSGLAINFEPDMGKLTIRNTDHFPSDEELRDVDPGQVLIMDMTGVPTSALPEDFGKFVNLKVYFNSFNPRAEELPEVLGLCPSLEFVGMRSCNIRSVPENSLSPSLRWLTLTDNHIDRLPDSIGNCEGLQNLLVAGNRLGPPPEALGNCRRLEKVRWSVNNSPSTPEWFLQMPNLAWLVDSGNPGSMQADTSQAKNFDWNEIKPGDVLGKNAKNEVIHGLLPDRQEVAIKLYGHEVSTDGSPEDALGAALLIGEHPHIVGGIGKLVHPDGRQGLVMPLIPDEFKALAGPPNFASVSRDIYPDGQTYSLPFVQNVLRSVSAAMVYSHSKGGMNGDLYGHNILTNNAGVSKVTDLEAMTVYKPGTREGRLRERVDVRAFGILMGELLDRCDSPETEGTIAVLRQLQTYCLNETVLDRPAFADIDESLAKAA